MNDLHDLYGHVAARTAELKRRKLRRKRFAGVKGRHVGPHVFEDLPRNRRSAARVRRRERRAEARRLANTPQGKLTERFRVQEHNLRAERIRGARASQRIGGL